MQCAIFPHSSQRVQVPVTQHRLHCMGPELSFKVAVIDMPIFHAVFFVARVPSSIALLGLGRRELMMRQFLVAVLFGSVSGLQETPLIESVGVKASRSKPMFRNTSLHIFCQVRS